MNEVPMGTVRPPSRIGCVQQETLRLLGKICMLASHVSPGCRHEWLKKGPPDRP